MSYQLWFLSNSVFNFLSMFLLLRTLKFRWIPSTAGSWLFAFGLVRGAYLSHSQLMPHYYIVLGLISAIYAYRASDLKYKYLGSIGAGILFGLQFWVGLYLFWMSFLIFGIALLCSFIFYDRKTIFKNSLTWKHQLASGIASMLLIIIPLGLKYLDAQSAVGARKWGDVTIYLPKVNALLLPPPDTWFYHFLFEMNFNVKPNYSEMFLFQGFLPFLMVAFAVGCCFNPSLRRSIWIQCGIIWILCMCVLQHDIWKVIYYTVPGASAIRSMGRLSVASLLPLSICFAGATQTIQDFVQRKLKCKHFGVIAATLIFLALILDNGATFTYGFSIKEHRNRVDSIRDKVTNTSCAAFYISGTDSYWKTQLDAMWLSIESSVPTLNGYSGNNPPHYDASGMNGGILVTQESIANWYRSENWLPSDAKSTCIVL